MHPWIQQYQYQIHHQHQLNDMLRRPAMQYPPMQILPVQVPSGQNLPRHVRPRHDLPRQVLPRRSIPRPNRPTQKAPRRPKTHMTEILDMQESERTPIKHEDDETLAVMDELRQNTAAVKSHQQDFATYNLLSDSVDDSYGMADDSESTFDDDDDDDDEIQARRSTMLKHRDSVRNDIRDPTIKKEDDLFSSGPFPVPPRPRSQTHNHDPSRIAATPEYQIEPERQGVEIVKVDDEDQEEDEEEDDEVDENTAQSVIPRQTIAYEHLTKRMRIGYTSDEGNRRRSVWITFLGPQHKTGIPRFQLWDGPDWEGKIVNSKHLAFDTRIREFEDEPVLAWPKIASYPLWQKEFVHTFWALENREDEFMEDEPMGDVV